MSFKAHAAPACGDPAVGRYQAQEYDGTWQIIDSVTNLPAASAGRDFVKLCKSDAVDIATELNRCEAEGTTSPLI
jgi:hypothetical protein